MKKSVQVLFAVVLVIFCLGAIWALLSRSVTTAVAEAPSKIVQSDIYATNALTPTVFLPIIQKPIPPLPQGHGLLFLSDRVQAEAYDIYNMNLDGSHVQRLTNLDMDFYYRNILPRWSPDGTQIAFQNEGTLYLLSSDGSNLETLLDESMMAVDGVIAWSPDGKKIAYMARNCKVPRPLCNEFVGGGVRVIDLQTKVITQSIPDGIHMYNAVDIQWLPDGQSLMAVPHEGGGTDNGIIIGYIDGTPARWILTHYIVDDFELSPDGQKIIFEVDSNLRAYTADINGNNLKKVFDGVSNATFVSDTTWHPSGNKIAYVLFRYSDSVSTIYVANADGSGAHDILPSYHSHSTNLWGWTPDGSKIIFESDKNHVWWHYDIYTMNEDGSSLTNLTSDSDADNGVSDYFP